MSESINSEKFKIASHAERVSVSQKTQRHVLRKIIFSLFIFFLFTSCTKFDEGPKFSILPAKMRLTGSWEIEKVYDVKSNESITANYYGVELTVKKDETYSKVFLYNGNKYDENGIWSMNEDSILFVHNEYEIDYKESYKILRLTNKEFWLVDDKKELHYKKQK